MTEYYNMNYGGKEVQVESAVRDEEGYSIKGCYAKKNEIKDGVLTINTNGGSALGTFSANQSTNQTITLPNGTVQLLNQSVTFVSDNTYEEFPYRASVSVTGVTASTYAEVTYSEEQATSLNFATFCDTATNVIYLYSRTNVGTVTIPTISIGMDYSDITIDSTPTSGSGNAVSSGGVYTALEDYVDKSSAQNITGVKSFIDQRTIFKRTDADVSVAPSTLIYMNGMQFTDKNGAEAGAIFRQYNTDGGAQLILLTSSKMSGSVQEARLNINIAGDGTTKYVEAPYRTSGITVNDVLTAGNGVTLGTAQTITGSKTFSSSGYTNVQIQSGNTTGFLGGVTFKDSNGTDKSWISAGVGGDLYLHPTANITYLQYTGTYPNSSGLNNRFYFTDNNGNIGCWLERWEDAYDAKVNIGVRNYTSAGGETIGYLAISKGTGGKAFSWFPPQWQFRQIVRNPSFNVYERPSGYTFGEVSFVDINDVPYMKLRATCDQAGSRRFEICIMDINNVEHWTTLASRTD